ncbi:hypothetical protein [Streptomyces spinosirectus]
MAFTAADVRDLIQRIKADGGADTAQLAQFEAYANSLEGESPCRPIGASDGAPSSASRWWPASGRRRVDGQGAQTRLAEGGPLPPRYGNKIADAVDAVENWGEHALTPALMRAGLPSDVAGDLAKAIILVAA